MSEASARTSKRQQQLMDFVRQYIADHDNGPSYREVMAALGYKSVSTVAIHIDALIAKGYLRKTSNSARSLEIIMPDQPPDDAHRRWLKQYVARHTAATGADKAEVARALAVLGLDTIVPPTS